MAYSITDPNKKLEMLNFQKYFKEKPRFTESFQWLPISRPGRNDTGHWICRAVPLSGC